MKNTPFMYDLVISHALEWPSVTVQWLPSEPSLDSDDSFTAHNLILDFHTSDDYPNFLLVVEAHLPVNSSTSLESNSENHKIAKDPLEVSGLPNNIVKISAGYYHSSAITEDGELYMWGKNSSGQLGLGKKVGKVIPVPSKVEFLNGVAIRMVALGSDHSIAVTETREVLSWVGGESGRLGHGHKSSLLGFLSSTRYGNIYVSIGLSL